MNPLESSLAEMSELFNARMAKFEAQLNKSPEPSTTSSSLALEFSSFRAFITEALNNLQQQVEMLARMQDNTETRSRRKMLIIHGVAETKGEQIEQVLSNFIGSHLALAEFSSTDIRRCHRMNRLSTSEGSRPILIKFQTYEMRSQVWFSKTKLKGTGFTISEFLTKARHDIFMAARSRFGMKKVWTKDGCVYILGADGIKHRVVTHRDLNHLQKNTSEAVPEVDAHKRAVTKPAVVKAKRAAARK
ncbi:uncharacterized protein LOC114244220 [Bombyx mandarina]|uniref:Uncharacterized protein LOC114244220 n=1 Tax=Bombyx mandarina TaxID=7092 RepID=A0A6J2JQB7_BOMMA|nr:uncharacterized protein LOC114244220 [Bombyx mandarina]